MQPRDQTIFALSSGRPPSAIAIVRMSGPQARIALQAVTGNLPSPRVATRALLRNAAQQAIDDAVVLWFPGPASATGEDVAEFHLHGGRAVLAALFAALSSFENVRAAEAGEFTRRAFENGKLDLTEAEGLDDLIHADTDRQRAQALRQLKGLLGDKARNWREQIIEALALIEAGIDFSDEGDVPAELIAPAVAKIKALHTEIEEVLAAQGRSERLRDGLVVAIAGPPNVGKSTLMNQLARREIAIVSPHAGTTRDVIEVQLDLDGYPVTVIDTAGIRETEDPVEQEGVRRARARAAEADLVLWVIDDARQEPELDGPIPLWIVLNKMDMPVRSEGPGFDPASPRHAVEARWERRGGRIFAISAMRGDGVHNLITELIRFVQSYFGGSEEGLLARARHRELLRNITIMLHRSIEVAGRGDELVAEYLRAATHDLSRLLGRVDLEDVLDKIFGDFCIGK